MILKWMRNKLFLASLVIIGLTTSVCNAQAEGNGLLIGETRLHLGIGLEGGYDSNVNYQPSSYAMHDATLHIKPNLKLITPPKGILFELGGGIDGVKYFGVDDPKSADYSTVNADASLNLTINPNGQLKLILSDIFSRNNDPRSDAIGNFNRTTNSAGATIQYVPAGGAFILESGYKFYFDLFDKDTGLSFMDSISHQPYLYITWKFFPKTAFVIDSSLDMRSYPNQYNENGRTFTNQDQMGIRATAGIMGLLTPRLSTILKVGYGDTFASKGDNYRSAIGQFELTYDFNIQSKASFGYSRDFKPVSMYGYYGEDKVYARLAYLLAGRIMLNLGGSFAYQLFGRPLVPDPDLTGNTDLVADLNATVEFMINRMLSAGVSDTFTSRISDRKDIAKDNISYNRNLSLLFIKFYY
jgi:hypothetical protein